MLASKLIAKTKTQIRCPLTRLFAKNRTCSEFNLNRLKQLNQPIAKIKSIKSNGQATAKKARGLWHTLHSAKNANIRMTENLWTEAGVYNGIPATAHEIIYQPQKQPPEFPSIVLVHIPHFKGQLLEI